MFVAIVAAAPSLALLTYFYLRDRYEREPIGHVVAAYLLGMFALLAAQGATYLVADWVSPDWLHTGGEPARLFDAFVLAGAVEELSKWVMLVAAVYAWREFDEPMDGLLYGVAIALGFATFENFLFLSSRGLAIASAARNSRPPMVRICAVSGLPWRCRCSCPSDFMEPTTSPFGMGLAGRSGRR